MRFEKLVNDNESNMGDVDFYIYRYIRENTEEILKMSINELAEHCNTSRTSIMRFAKKLGLSGYAELKFLLKHDQNSHIVLSEEVIGNIYADYITSIRNLSHINLDEVCEAIYNAHNIFAYGTGIVQVSAIKELKRLMYKSGKLIHIISGDAEVNVLKKQIKPEDLLITVSLNGKNQKMLEIGDYIKNKGTAVISITRNGINPLAQLSDYNIYFEQEIREVSIGNQVYEPINMTHLVCELLFLKYSLYVNSMK